MYAWVTTAYLLTSTVSVPIYGKLSDQYGRKPILIIGVVRLSDRLGAVRAGGEFGSLPVLGDGMMQLIVFRAVQGLGAGALMTVSFAIMADMYPPRERGRLFGVFGSVFGLATVIGPFIGGYLTDHGAMTLFGYEIAGWRWVFYVNLPLGLLALFMILYRLPRCERHATDRRRGLPPISATWIIRARCWWCSPPRRCCLALPWAVRAIRGTPRASLGLFWPPPSRCVVFIRVESRADQSDPASAPVPHSAHSASPRCASFVMSMAFLGVVMFMPLYMQVVQGVSATQSGVRAAAADGRHDREQHRYRSSRHAHRPLQAVHARRRRAADRRRRSR